MDGFPVMTCGHGGEAAPVAGRELGVFGEDGCTAAGAALAERCVACFHVFVIAVSSTGC